MTLTDEQLALRRKGITATDIPKICGVHPYGGAVDVLLSKQGLAEPFIDTDRVKWGNILEEPIRKDYEERHFQPREVDPTGVVQLTGLSVVVPGTIIHPQEGWAMATPDGILFENFEAICAPPGSMEMPLDPIRGLEIKTHTSYLSHLYGEPGTDQVPAWELLQCAWNLYVARAYYEIHMTRWDLTAFIDGIPTDYVITRDPELEEMIVEKAQRFWQHNVVEGKPLEPDGTNSYSKYLSSRFPKNSDILKEADKPALESIEALRCVRGEIKNMEKDEEKLVQHIKSFIGENAGVVFKGDEKKERITWKKTKDVERTDWKAVYQELISLIWLNASASKCGPVYATNVAIDSLCSGLLEESDKVIAKYTKSKPGSRRFVVPGGWHNK